MNEEGKGRLYGERIGFLLPGFTGCEEREEREIVAIHSHFQDIFTWIVLLGGEMQRYDLGDKWNFVGAVKCGEVMGSSQVPPTAIGQTLHGILYRRDVQPQSSSDSLGRWWRQDMQPALHVEALRGTAQA